MSIVRTIKPQLNKALYFNGVNSYIFIARNTITDNIGLNFSVFVWISTRDTGSAGWGKAWIIDKDIPGTRTDDWFFGINYGKEYLVLGDKEYYSTDVIADGAFHFIGFSRARYQSVLLFWDGKTAAFSDPGYDMRNTQNIYISSEKGSGRFFQGYIAQILIYYRVLSQAEIQHNMRNPSNPISDGLILWLDARACDTTKNICYDLSGNGNHGTMYNISIVTLSNQIYPGMVM